MSGLRSAFGLSAFCLALVMADRGEAQSQIPLQGPGLGNLTYTDAELFREISRITWNTDTYKNGIPATQPPQNAGNVYGHNVGIMLNGYFVTMFAPDSGQRTGGFQIYDVSDPRNIRKVKDVYDPNGLTADFREPHSFGVAEVNGRDYLAIQSGNGVEFWDFTDVNTIRPVRKVALPGINGGDYEDASWQLFWQAPYLYVAAGGRGLYIVDARDPTNAVLANRGSNRPNPIPVGALGGSRIGPVFAFGNQLVVTSMESSAGFASLDIADPLNPVVVGARTSVPQMYSMCFNGQTVGTSGRNGNGVAASYLLSNPRTITVQNENTAVEEGLYCATQDNSFFVGAQRHVFKFDASNPSRFVEVGRTERVADPTTKPALAKGDPDLGQVTIFGNLVFVGSDHGHNTAFRPHQKAPDTTRPTVIASSPAAGATGMAPSSRIGFGLSDNILPESLNANTFIVRPKGGSQLAGVYSLQLGLINFTPSAGLQPNTEYEVILRANGLKDYAGNGLGQDYTMSFTTGQQAQPGRLFHRWPLNGTLVDVVAGNDGTASSADVFNAGALDTTNRSSGVTLESDGIADALGSSATVSFRMRTTQTGNNAPWLAPGIFGRDQVDGDNDVFWGWLDGSGRLNLSVGNASGSNPGTRSTNPINDGQWHNVVMTRDANTGAQALYVDGVKTTSNSTPGVLGLANKTQMLGQIQGNPVNFKGQLADLRIYGSVLGEEEISGLFGPDGALVNRWPLNNSLTDVAGGNNGTQTNADFYREGGLDTASRTSGVSLGSSAIADTLAGSASVTFRMKTTQVGNNRHWLAPGIFGRDQDLGDNDVFWGWLDGSGHLNLSVGDPSASNPGTRTPRPVNDGQWHEVALTRNAETGVQAIYVDGVKTTSNSRTGLLGLGTRLQTLGQLQGSPATYQGLLSDVRVYSRPLTEAEIATVFEPASALVHRWPLADSLLDVASSNDGTPSSADAFQDNGLNTAGRNTGIQLESDAASKVLSGTATVTFRLKNSQGGNNAAWQAPGLFGRDQNMGANDAFWGWLDGSGRINLSVGDPASDNPGTRSTNAVNNGQWNNIALTRNAETGAQAVYVNGTKTTSNSRPGIMGLDVPFQLLGQIQGNPTNLKGTIADVRVYRRVLSDKQIQGVFQPDSMVLAARQVGSAVTFEPANMGISGASYVWNFGDNSEPVTTSSSSPNVSHTYQAPGNYTVTVTVINADGSESPHAFIQTVNYPATQTPPVHTSNIVGSGSAVYALDPDAGTVAALDAGTNAKSWEVRVGREPKTLAIDPTGRIWVAVQGDDKLVRIDPVTRELTEYPTGYGSGPYGVAFTPDGRTGVVTFASKSTLALFSHVNGAIGTRLVLPGGDARGIAVSGDSRFAYVTRFRSRMVQGDLYKVDLNTMASPTTIKLSVDTTTLAHEAAAPGVANYLNQIVISPDGRRAILPSKKDNIVNGRFRNGKDLQSDTTVRSVVSQVDLASGAEVPAEQIDFNNRAPARAALFAPLGNYMFVAQMESNSVEIVDSYRRTIIGSIVGVGRAPHGLYLDASRKKLFVNNFLDRTVSVHDVSNVITGVDFVTPLPTVVRTVATEPLAANVLAGKRVFYNAADPRMSRDQYMSCASCHVDGDSDDIVWDFTQRGEGLRRTISLQGKQGVVPAGSGRLHWSGNFNELQDFESDIRGQFGGTGFLSSSQFQQTTDPLGPNKAGMSTELDNLAAYVTSLSTFARSPHKDAQGCLPMAALAGRTTFQNAQCSTCHGTSATQQDNQRHDVGTIQASSGQGANQALANVGFDTPSLHGLWQSSSFFHNGQAKTLRDVFATSNQSGGANFSSQHGGRVAAGSVDNLLAYLQTLDGTNSCSTAQ